MVQEIKIIGAGLAGSEAAYQLANAGLKVKLYEAKKVFKNAVQKLDGFAELVCSNTLRSLSTTNAVGILKKEMAQFNSLILEAALATRIPSDDALAVDRQQFSNYITNVLQNHPNIEIFNEEITQLQEQDELTLVASGPLTTENLALEIQRLLGKQKTYYLDASAPIVQKETIDFSKTYWASRHKTNDGQYLCLPLNQNEFETFRDQLLSGQTAALHDFEKEIYFQGCMPLEVLAKKGRKPLLNGPLSPNNLEKPDRSLPYAVVQLRQDDAVDSLYNFVGFQTNLKWTEQKRIFSSLPGMANAHFVRFGVLHKNYYINSPKILNHHFQVMRQKNLFFAGQITGVEGYIESAATGIVASLGIRASLQNKKLPKLPSTTVLGALTNYITNPKIKKLKPMKANLGIVTKSQTNQTYYDQSQSDLANYLEVINKLLK